ASCRSPPDARTGSRADRSRSTSRLRTARSRPGRSDRPDGAACRPRRAPRRPAPRRRRRSRARRSAETRAAARAACRRTGSSRHGRCACRSRRCPTAGLASPPRPAPAPAPGSAGPRPPRGPSSRRRGRSSSSHLVDPHPAALRRRALHRLADRLHARAVHEIRLPRAAWPPLEQVGRLVHEARAVADPLADRPPVACVRVRRVLGADPPEPVEEGVLSRVAVPELVQARVVESQRPPRPVDLEREVARTARADARHLEGATGAVREADEAGGRLVDVDRTPAPLARERLRLGGRLVDAADDPQREVDEVRPQVGDRARAHRALEAPVERDVRVEKLVGQPRCPPEQHLAHRSLVHHPLQQRERRQPPVVEADGVRNAGGARRVRRRLRGRVIRSQRLLAQHRLPQLDRGPHDLGVRPGRRADVDELHVVARQKLPPVHRPLGHAVTPGGGGERVRAPAADRTDTRDHRQLAHARSELVAVGVRAAHRAVADDSDADLFHERGPYRFVHKMDTPSAWWRSTRLTRRLTAAMTAHTVPDTVGSRRARPGNQTVRLTAAQALMRFLAAQHVERDGVEHRFFGGCFGIFGHGNVAGIGEALFESPELLTYYQARNEQAMVHTAAGYARMRNRLGTLVCTTSIGPGATNMVTGAALATVNRLPVLLLPGDVFASRRPDPVLQQLETPWAGDVSVNDCFRPVSRYFDRIWRPEQVVPAALQAMRVLVNQAETGAVTLAIPQDVQAEAFDCPTAFLDRRVWRIPRTLPDPALLREAAGRIRASRRPLIVAGGGTIYSEATEALRRLCDATGIPVAETQAGKGSLPYDHPSALGAIGVTGTFAANRLAAQADLVVGLGTRWSDFTTASKTLFRNPDVSFVNVNVCDFDAAKHAGLQLVGDARATLEALADQLETWSVDDAYRAEAERLNREWDAEVERLYRLGHGPLPSQAEVIGAVNAFSAATDVVVCAAG